MTRHVQRQLRQQRHLLHLELPASYSNRLMSKFGRNGYEASFGCGAADAAAAAIEFERSSDGGGGGVGGSSAGGGGGVGGRECGSRADDLNSLDGDVMLMEEGDDEDEFGDEMLLGALPTPASEQANRVLVNAPPQPKSNKNHTQTNSAQTRKKPQLQHLFFYKLHSHDLRILFYSYPSQHLPPTP